MTVADGARTFRTTGEACDGFMGRYPRSLAAPFADAAGVGPFTLTARARAASGRRPD